MKKEALIEEVTALAKGITDSLGYELYHVEFTKEDGENYLRIYIDNENGITLDDCAKVSSAIGAELDEIDPIKDPYYLEISSPGVNRVLHTDKHINDNIGKIVVVKTVKPVEGNKSFKGKLEAFDEINLEILVDSKTINIERVNVKSINVDEF